MTKVLACLLVAISFFGWGYSLRGEHVASECNSVKVIDAHGQRFKCTPVGNQGAQ